MQRPTVLEGIIIALLASLAVAPLFALLSLGFGTIIAGKATLVLLAFPYIVYLLTRRGTMPGRIILGLSSLLVCLAALALELRWPTLALVVAVLVGGIRAYAYSHGIVPALLHGGLCVLGLGAALWTYAHSHSIALTSWSFFLTQAIFPFLPTRLGQAAQAQPTAAAQEADDFVVAHQAAQKALQRLSLQAGR